MFTITIHTDRIGTPELPFTIYRDRSQTKEINPSWAWLLAESIHKAFAYTSTGTLCWRESRLPPSLQAIVRKHNLVFKEVSHV